MEAHFPLTMTTVYFSTSHDLNVAKSIEHGLSNMLTENVGCP